jgi:hypothetical protein
VVGFRINVAATVVVTRGVNLRVSKVGQIGRSKSFWCTISMSVEHVNTQHSLSRDRRREKRQSNNRFGQHFGIQLEEVVDSKTRGRRRLLPFYRSSGLIIGKCRRCGQVGNPSSVAWELLIRDSLFFPALTAIDNEAIHASAEAMCRRDPSWP